MVQPKYSPEEALQRIKLMMKYDTSKTLNENKIIIEQISPSAAMWGTSGAISGSMIGATAAGAAGAAAGSVVPVVGTAVGFVVGAGLGMLIDWWAKKDLGSEGFKQVMSACSSKGADKLVPQLSKADIRNIAYAIEDAKGDWNDDEDAIKSAIERIPTIGDLCAVDKKISGGLYQFLNDLTDSPDEWKMFTRPLVGMVEDTEFVVNPEEEKKQDGSKPPKPTKTGYTPCSGTYKYTCKSPVIATVQRCLKIKDDGLFGPNTRDALSAKGYTTFTDADVDKICNKPAPPTVNSDEEDVEGSDPNQI